MKTELFKMDANGKIRVWRTWTEHFAKKSVLYTQSGVNGHKLVLTTQEFTNYDRYDKAEAQLRTNINYNKDRKGYTEDIPICRPYRPMLLHKYTEMKDQLPNRVIIQPKLNGERCMASRDWLMSRTGNKFLSLDHIRQILSFLPEDVVVDGELYCHGMSLSEIQSAVNRIDATPTTLKIKYYIYDVVASIPYSDRLKYLEDIKEHLTTSYVPDIDFTEPHVDKSPCPVQFLQPLEVTQEEVNEHYSYFLKCDYEGAVIRNPHSTYQLNVRSPGVLKLKPFKQKWFTIKDVVPYEKDKSQGKFVCITSNGNTFSCTYKASSHIRSKILRLKHIYIGKPVLVEFEDYSDLGKPLKPVAKEVQL